MTGEETVLVWDAAHRTEHFVRTPTFEGDPASFGFFMPSPTTPVIDKADPAIAQRLAALLAPPGLGGIETRGGGAGAAPAAAAPVEVTQRVKIDDFEIASLKATDADALGMWLGKNGFLDKPSLREWAKHYVERGWIISAMRYAGAKDKKPEKMAAPTLRFTFPTDHPFYPYLEPAEDPADALAFAKRSGACAEGADCVVSRARQLDLYFVSHGPARATIDDAPGGPFVTQVVELGSASIAGALGDTSRWSFSPNDHEKWTVTHFVDNAEVRMATNDVVFAAIGSELPVAPKRRALAEAAPLPKSQRPKTKRILFGAVGLVAFLAALLALRDDKRRAA